MGDLPDELLLFIFSRVTDGPTLLTAVPLVCKRWRQVSSDPAAWRGVTVCVQANRVASSIERTVLTVAPVVGSLHVSLSESPPVSGGRPNNRFLRAIEKVVVCTELSLQCDPPRWLRKGYLELVWRSRNQLKRLSIVLDNKTKTELGHSPVDVLSQMPCLEELTVYVHKKFVYKSGELKDCFPNLKGIKVVEKPTGTRQHDLIKDLLVDSLVRAHFRPCFPPRPDLLTALEKCQKIESLYLNWEFTPVFKSLPALKDVTIDLTVEVPLQPEKVVQAFCSLYTPTVEKVHVLVEWCVFRCSWLVLVKSCQSGVRALKKRGFNGTITYAMVA
ncbi:uncharacterized protein LOC117652962 isoform X2 [Thrips palmi]|nr:uncharacterized protein LOC117652962 isoform X2 [Thrips palmi]